MDVDVILEHLSGAERVALYDDTESEDEGMTNLEEQDAGTTQPSNRRGAIPAPHGDDRYDIFWANQFVSQFSIGQCSGDRADYFRKLFPTRWGKQHLLPATNKTLKNNGHAETYWEEIEGWLGLWVMMSLNPS